MSGSGIFDGDLVVVRRQNHAEPGEIVVASVYDEMTLKCWWPCEGAGYVDLVPSNPDFPTIRSELALVWGVLVGRVEKADQPGLYRCVLCRVPRSWRPGHWRDLPPHRKDVAHKAFPDRPAAMAYRRDFNEAELASPAGLWVVVQREE